MKKSDIFKNRFKNFLKKENKERNKFLINEDSVSDEYGILSVPKRNIWVFNSGMNFSGNPKWLFVYINKYRPDIKAFWMCYEEDTMNYVRSLGYKAYLYTSKEGIEISTAAGVYVTEQCKEIIPEYLKDCVCLNLYHGVGCKSIERKVNYGFLFERIMKKYIVNNEYYLNNMIFLVTSPLMKEHFKEQVGLTDDMVVEAGYPRCVYQQYYEKVESFDHDILRQKGRTEDTKIVVYAPTYRDNPNFDFVKTLLPDMDALEAKLKANNQLLVFKIHPLMAKDEGFSELKEKYYKSPYFLFWDNKNDIYEIIDRIDVAVIDYSSIFYDFLAGGVKNFIRYFADYGSTDMRDNVFDYKEMTCGKVCESFDEFLSALDTCGCGENEEADRQRVYDLFWEYSGEDTMDRIIDAALNYKIKKAPLPTLYTFDIFDTIISRKGLHPSSIFCKVKEEMAESDLGFERYFISSYIEIRRMCEQNVREYRNKTVHLRETGQREISFDSIFERMADVYSLSPEQIAFLKEHEIEAELNDTIPVPEMIAYAESLISRGEKVLLISDMYLPSAIIKKMISKSSDILASVPIYVSCEYGVQKSTGFLYHEVFRDFDFYNFGTWIHYGDNNNADGEKAKALGITPVRHSAPALNVFENKIVNKLGTYDSYLVAAMMARFRQRNGNRRDYFSYAYASLCLVPYSVWVVEDAVKRGTDTLYFIARDGYHTQRIADIAIEKLGLNIKTKYIYGSRKAWRIPSFINEFDESFFTSFGNLAISTTFEEVLSALSIDKEQFNSFFPSLSDMETERVITKSQMAVIISTVKESTIYRDYLLSLAAGIRVNVDKYLAQEIDFNEKFAFVDFWGRGYTQTCFTRLVHNLEKREFDVPYYYIRSIYPTEGYNIRYNYTSKNTSMLVAEALCSSNIDYQSVKEYCEREDGVMVPIIEAQKCDKELLESMRVRLCEFTYDLFDLDLIDRASTLRALLEYGLEYYNANQGDPLIIENIATLGYALTTYGEEREYAPALSKEDIEIIVSKKTPLFHFTNSLTMSLKRSDQEVVDYYNYLTKEKGVQEKTINKNNEKTRNSIVKDFKNRKYNFETTDKKQKENVAYTKIAKKPVEDKVVIINVYEGNEADFDAIVSYYEAKGFEVVIIPLKGKYKGKELADIATAKYIYMSDVSGWFARIDFRKETKLVQMYKEPLPLSGMSQTIKENATDDRIQRILRIHNVVYDVVSCTGESVLEILEKTLIKAENVKCIKAFGHPLTDVYNNDVLKERIRGKLSAIVPENHKKLMVYLPKSSDKKRFSYQFLDLEVLRKLFGEEYNIVVVSNNGDDLVSNYASSFEKSVYNGFSVITQREAIAVADVVIGDCTAVILETVITGKPLYLTSLYSEKSDGSSLFTKEEINIFPLIRDPYDMIPYREGRVEYDFEAYESFREKHFCYCNGRCVEQTDEYLNMSE